MRLISLKNIVVFLIIAFTLVIIAKYNSTPTFVQSSSYNEPDKGILSKFKTRVVDEDAAVGVVGNKKTFNNDWDYPFEDDPVKESKKDSNINYINDLERGGPNDILKGVNKLSKNKKNEKQSKRRQMPKFKLNYSGPIKDIKCDINGKYAVGCKKQEDEIFVPFSFLSKYFEIFGKMSEDDNKFLWLHQSQQAKIFRPTSYNPEGVFAYFDNYNVEVRDRVKCISGSTGVPISTQWDVKGYFYPIQIAQFGLTHYSKYINEGDSIRYIIENGGDSVRGSWVSKSKEEHDEPLVVSLSSLYGKQIRFQPFSQYSLPISSKQKNLILSWQMKNGDVDVFKDSNSNQANFTLTVKIRYELQEYFLHYQTNDVQISSRGNEITHGLGNESFEKFQSIIRDIPVDLQKGLQIAAQSQNQPKSKLLGKNWKITRSKVLIETIFLTSDNVFYIDNLTLSSQEHLNQFYQAADWFVQNQDANGGWPISVRRKFSDNFYPVLEPGWYSAMGQGHALSILARAYFKTKEEKYAEAASRSLMEIFDKLGSEGGVRAIFLDKFVWYEEYPTTPSTFVLNGFMYALLGLYDIKTIGVPGAEEKASELYDEGLISLKNMLPLYDTGSGTLYDLRHFSISPNPIPPNLARIDYHVTHINQLLTFATIEHDQIFSTIAERFIGYINGERAPHN